MSCGWLFSGPCPSPYCESKTIVAVITPYGYTGSGCTSNPITLPVVQNACNNYCPGLWNMIGGPFSCGGDSSSPSCGCVTNLTAWIASQDFESVAWGGGITGFFQDGNASSPYCTVTGSSGFGDPAYGSIYEEDGILVAQQGTLVGNVCAFAQIAAYKMTGPLYLTPVDLPGISASCVSLPSPFNPACVNQTQATYYVPMPPTDLCTSGTGFQVQYQPYVNSSSQIGCAAEWSGGSVSNCLTPDPFYGASPP